MPLTLEQTRDNRFAYNHQGSRVKVPALLRSALTTVFLAVITADVKQDEVPENDNHTADFVLIN